MNEPPADEAVAAARVRLDIAPDVAVRVWPVWPPEGPGPAYRLIEFGDPGAVVGIAAVDALGGQVMSSAHLPGTGPHLSLTKAEAVERAGLSDAAARLVWSPSRQSRSPLYPIWEVRAGRELVFVDLQGNVWPALEPGGPGGSPETPPGW